MLGLSTTQNDNKQTVRRIAIKRSTPSPVEVLTVRGNELKRGQSPENAIHVLSLWRIGEVIQDEAGFFLVYGNSDSLKRLKGSAREVFVSTDQQLTITRLNGFVSDIAVHEITNT